MTKSGQRNRQITKEQKERLRTKKASATPSTEQLTKNNAKQESDHAKQEKGQQDVLRPSNGKDWEPFFAVILATLIGSILGIASLPWPSYPSLSLWVTAVACLLLNVITYWVLTRKVWRTSSGRIKLASLSAGGIILLVSLGGQTWIFLRQAQAPEVRELRGLLVPAREPNPPLRCGNLPASAFLLNFGDSAVWTETAKSAITLNAIRFAGENVLTFERTANGILVNATIRDEKGSVVATINKNVFRARSGSGYDAQSPDIHSILVLDDKDQVTLYVRYINSQAVKVLGIFHKLGRPPLVIDEGGITMPEGGHMSGGCIRVSWQQQVALEVE
jgi:hypothetical protein